ncbi:hypothetical protein PSRE111525_18905 [Pseudomonas reidholzensis]
MRQRIVDQVAEQFIEQGRLTLEPHRRLRLQRQRHPPRMGQRRHGHPQLTRQLTQVEALRPTLGNRPRTVLHPRQRQQLVGQVGQPVGPLCSRLQGLPPLLRLMRAQPQLDPRLQRRQRRAQFMGGIGNELRLALELPAQPLGKMIERPHQRPQLALHLDHRQGPQVIRLALLHRRAQALQRTQRGADGEPHHHQCAQRQHAQAQQGIGHQALGHAHPRLLGLGHANLRHAVHVRLADRLEQAHHAHVLAEVTGVVEPRQGRVVIGARRARRRWRQVLVARNQPLVDIQHLVVDAPGAVVGKGVQGHIGHIGTERAVALRQARGNGPRRGQQGPVVGGVGGLAAVPVGTQAAGQHQHHQQQRQVAQQAPAQAGAVTHRGVQAGSRGRGR